MLSWHSLILPVCSHSLLPLRQAGSICPSVYRIICRLVSVSHQNTHLCLASHYISSSVLQMTISCDSSFICFMLRDWLVFNDKNQVSLTSLENFSSWCLRFQLKHICEKVWHFKCCLLTNCYKSSNPPVSHLLITCIEAIEIQQIVQHPEGQRSFETNEQFWDMLEKKRMNNDEPNFQCLQ